MGTVSGKKIAVLGFAFKKDTGDTRETPAIDVCRSLMLEKAKLAIYDPKVSREQIYADLGKESMENIMIDEDAYIACTGAHAIAVVTEWDTFKTLDYKQSTIQCRNRHSSSMDVTSLTMICWRVLASRSTRLVSLHWKSYEPAANLAHLTFRSDHFRRPLYTRV